MSRPSILFMFVACFSRSLSLRAEEEPLFTQKLNVNPPPIKDDPSVKYDYDIVYVRAPRAGDKIHKRFYTDFSQPVTMEPGADLMLLHPDGSEELLVAGRRRARSPIRWCRSTASGSTTRTSTTCRRPASGRRRARARTSTRST